MKKRIRSLIFGGLAGLTIILISFVNAISTSDFSSLLSEAVFGIQIFTLISCIILDNNFIREMIATICGWGFLKMPGLIIELDLDGILWFLTVKLLFLIIGIILAIVFCILSIMLALMVSVFVYPFALYKNIKNPNE